MFHRVLMSMPPWLVIFALFVLFFVVFPAFLTWTSVKREDSTFLHSGWDHPRQVAHAFFPGFP